MLVGIASELQIRPKCKCNFEGENVNRVAGGEGGCRDSRKIKINKKLASSEISISCPRKNYNRQGKWRVISSPFSNDRDVIVEVRRLRYARVCVRECMCRNICTYNWNGLLLKNNKKKKKKRTRRSDTSLAQDRFKNSIEFETVRNSLSNPWIRNVYTFTDALSVILLPTSAQTFLLQIHSGISPEILDLTILEIAI